jgi:molecular chaperone DnaJ
MAAKRDYYEVLGLGKNASEDEIKKAYRKLAMQHHPDRNPGDKVAEDKFKEAAEAYSVLSDGDKKSRYDRMGHAGLDGQGGFGGQGGFSAEDIFSQFGSMFGDDFGSFFGGQRGGGGQRPGGGRGQRGTNLRIKVKLTLEEIATGVNKKIKVKKQVGCTTCKGSGAKDSQSVATCGTCRGSGMVRERRQTFMGIMETTGVCPTCQGNGQTISAQCGSCRGEGVTMGEETVDINIPAGVSDDIQLSMTGHGNAGRRKGPNGDLLISIEETPHEQLKREGINVIYELYINFGDAALGAKVEVPTLDGKAKVTIPAGIQGGKLLRLQGKGMPSLQSHTKGDQIIHVNVWTPRKFNDEERRLLEKLRDMPNFQPSPTKEDKGFFDRIRDFF